MKHFLESCLATSETNYCVFERLLRLVYYQIHARYEVGRIY